MVGFHELLKTLVAVANQKKMFSAERLKGSFVREMREKKSISYEESPFKIDRDRVP